MRETEETMDDFLKQLPPDYRPSNREIEQAYGIFGERNGVRPDIRMLFNKAKGKRDPCFRIIIDNRLCLWFYRRGRNWIFDGYECGDYQDLWNNFDYNPE